MFVNSDGTLAPLDVTMMSVESKGLKVIYKADEPTSKVVHSGKKSDQFIVKLGNINPENFVELLQFDVKKKARTSELANVKLGKKKADVEDNSIAIEMKKQSDGVFIFSTKEDLQPGEYFFLLKGGMGGSPTRSETINGQNIAAFCFTVK